jgi:hypothetical protein
MILYKINDQNHKTRPQAPEPCVNKCGRPAHACTKHSGQPPHGFYEVSVHHLELDLINLHVQRPPRGREMLTTEEPREVMSTTERGRGKQIRRVPLHSGPGRTRPRSSATTWLSRSFLFPPHRIFLTWMGDAPTERGERHVSTVTQPA